jgi:hypothetical protein
MTVAGDSVEETLATAAGILRTALHAAGFFTPSWPRLQQAPAADPLQADVEKLTLVPA